LGAPGGNDSIWMDLGYPVVTASDGRKFNPLFAWRVEELDGRLNLNVVGNLMGVDAGGLSTHTSNQGWGKWEVSLGPVLNQAGALTDWRSRLLGSATAKPAGRYGPYNATTPPVPRIAGATNLAPGGKLARFFAQVDYNAADDTNRNPTGKL